MFSHDLIVAVYFLEIILQEHNFELPLLQLFDSINFLSAEYLDVSLFLN